MVTTFETATSVNLRGPKTALIVGKQIKVEPVWDLPPMSKIHLDVKI
jgi:hypothetical protein